MPTCIANKWFSVLRLSHTSVRERSDDFGDHGKRLMWCLYLLLFQSGCDEYPSSFQTVDHVSSLISP